MMLDNLNWRYAVKKYDPEQTVPEDRVEQILEAIRLAPTSSGLQPFEVQVITNPGLRAQIRATAFDQAQVTDASHLLVFAAWDTYTAERIDDVVRLHASIRSASDRLDSYYERLKGMYLSRDARTNHEHAARQVYIALGFALAAAAALEVDATPMEGFDKDALDAVLGLPARGLHSVVILPLGVRAANGDWLQPLAKVRKPAERLFERRD